MVHTCSFIMKCFLRKLSFRIFSRSPGLRIIIQILPSRLAPMVSQNLISRLQWPDRLGFSPDSLLSLFKYFYSGIWMALNMIYLTFVIISNCFIEIKRCTGSIVLLLPVTSKLLCTGNVPWGVFCERSSKKMRILARNHAKHDFVHREAYYCSLCSQ